MKIWQVMQGNESLCSSGGSPAEADSLEVALQHNLTDRQLQTAFQVLVACSAGLLLGSAMQLHIG